MEGDRTMSYKCEYPECEKEGTYFYIDDGLVGYIYCEEHYYKEREQWVIKKIKMRYGTTN